MPHHVLILLIFHKYISKIIFAIDTYGCRCATSTNANHSFGCSCATPWGCPSTSALHNYSNNAVRRTQCTLSNPDIATEKATSHPMSSLLSLSHHLSNAGRLPRLMAIALVTCRLPTQHRSVRSDMCAKCVCFRTISPLRRTRARDTTRARHGGTVLGLNPAGPSNVVATLQQLQRSLGGPRWLNEYQPPSSRQ